MNPYRVKEIFWVVIALLYCILFLILGGCSSVPQSKMSPAMAEPQFCYTKKTIEVQDDEQVSSRTVVECDDDRVGRVAIKRAGLAQNCGVYNYWMKRGNDIVWKKGVSCFKPDGTWEIIDTDFR
jgi:uncharacterized protein YceK